MEPVDGIGNSDTLAEDDFLHRKPDRVAQTSALQDEWDPNSPTPVVEEEVEQEKDKPAENTEEEKKEEPKMLTEKQKEKLRKKEKYKNMPKSKSHGQVSFTPG